MPTARPPFSGYTVTGGGGGGGGAPANASYLVLGLDATLTDERVFSPVVGSLAATDNGAGATYVLDLASAGTAGTYAYPSSMTTDAYGRVTAVTAGGVVTTAVTPYAVAATDRVVFANSGVAQTINLPAAAAGLLGRTITIKRIGVNAPTVTVASLGGLIDGALNRTLTNYDSITVVCDGANWWTV